jgi:hypothetical protein
MHYETAGEVMWEMSKLLDADRIARAIEYTRFLSSYQPDDSEEGLLVGAADLIARRFALSALGKRALLTLKRWG